MYNSRLPIGYTTEQLPLAPFSSARARDFVGDANRVLDEEPLDFGPEYDEDVAMALISQYLEHHLAYRDVPKLTLGNIALDYLCLMPPQRINNRYGLHRWGKSQLQSTARDVAREAALLIDVDAENAEPTQEEVALEQSFLPDVDLKEAIRSLYDNHIVTPELYMGLLIFTDEAELPSNASPLTIARYTRLARESLRAKAARLKPDHPEYPRYLMRLLTSNVDGGNAHTLTSVIDQFRIQSKVSDFESAERIFKRLIGHELLLLYPISAEAGHNTTSRPSVY